MHSNELVNDKDGLGHHSNYTPSPNVWFWHIVLNIFQRSTKVGIFVFNYGCELKQLKKKFTLM
jgi:hypothetical protein